MNLFLLYIDPGTGSALFTIIIGIAAAAVFTVQALFLKIKNFFSGGLAIQKPKNKFVIYAEDKRYWTLFKQIVEEFENRNIELLYLTSSKDDPVFNNNYKNIKTEYLGEGNKAYARLNFLSAEFVLSTTPGLDVYQWRKSKNVKHYSHVLHSPELSTGYKMYGIDYYDSILASSSDQLEEFIRKLEKTRNLPEKKIVTVGCPYLDEYAKQIETITLNENSDFTILISPTWGKSGLLSRFGVKLIDPLANTDWKIIIRPHPQSLTIEKELIEKLIAKYKDNKNIEWDFNRENIYSLKKANVMISDFSGIILDYMFLCNKPVFYVNRKIDIRPYDAFEIYNDQEEMWIIKKLKKTGIPFDSGKLYDLPNLISNASYDNSLELSIKELKNDVWKYQGEAGKQIVDFMLETVDR